MKTLYLVIFNNGKYSEIIANSCADCVAQLAFGSNQNFKEIKNFSKAIELYNKNYEIKIEAIYTINNKLFERK